MMTNSDLPRNKERSVADIAAGNPRTCTGAGDNALRLPSHSRALSSVRHQHRPNDVRESPTARSLHAACESKGIIMLRRTPDTSTPPEEQGDQRGLSSPSRCSGRGRSNQKFPPSSAAAAAFLPGLVWSSRRGTCLVSGSPLLVSASAVSACVLLRCTKC